MRQVVSDGGCMARRSAVARIRALSAVDGWYTPESSRAIVRRMAFRRRLWETYHSRGRPAGSRFFRSGLWSGSVVTVATAIGNLLARWWNPHELPLFYGPPLTIAPGQRPFRGSLPYPWPHGDLDQSRMFQVPQRGESARCRGRRLHRPPLPGGRAVARRDPGGARPSRTGAVGHHAHPGGGREGAGDRGLAEGRRIA